MSESRGRWESEGKKLCCLLLQMKGVAWPWGRDWGSGQRVRGGEVFVREGKGTGRKEKVFVCDGQGAFGSMWASVNNSVCVGGRGGCVGVCACKFSFRQFGNREEKCI